MTEFSRRMSRARISALALTLALLFTALMPVHALYVGEVIDHVLYTEIRAYINGVMIPACNVSGRMMVTVEDLAGYGFDVYWDGSGRTLKVYRRADKAFSEIDDLTDWGVHNPGDIVGNVLHTDIVTYLEDVPCEAYNIGGRTVVALRSLSVYGAVDYDDPTHTASLTLFPGREEKPEPAQTDAPAKTEETEAVSPAVPEEPDSEREHDALRELSALRESLTEKSADSPMTRAIKRIQLGILDHSERVNLEGLGISDINLLISELNRELYGYPDDFHFKLCINKNYWCFDRVRKYYTSGSSVAAVDLDYVIEEDRLESIRSRYSDTQLEELRTLMLTMYNYYEISMKQFFTILGSGLDFGQLRFVLTAVGGGELADGSAFDLGAVRKAYYAAQSVIEDVNDYAKGAEQLKYIHDSIIGSFEYDGSDAVHSPFAMLYGGKGVCQAYSLLMKYYLDSLGYENCLAVNSGHQWNMVMLDGQWYHIDVTWDDLSGKTGYDYFLKSDRVMRADHDSWNAPHSAVSDRYDSVDPT